MNPTCMKNLLTRLIPDCNRAEEFLTTDFSLITHRPTGHVNGMFAMDSWGLSDRTPSSSVETEESAITDTIREIFKTCFKMFISANSGIFLRKICPFADEVDAYTTQPLPFRQHNCVAGRLVEISGLYI